MTNIFKPRIPTETEDCMALVEWMELKRLKFAHVPQETYTKSWAVKMKNRRMGVRKGVPDYLIVHGTQVLFIEMKRKGSSPSDTSPEQIGWLKALNLVPGIKAHVCKGYDEAVRVITQELQLTQ